MSVGSAMVDKAQILRKQAVGEVDGATRYEEAPYGDLFRAFYDPGDQTESRSESAIRRAKPANVLFAKRDIKGQPVNVLATDRIRIISQKHGTVEAEVQGAPTAVGKRRSVLALRVNLYKVQRTD